MPAKKRKRFSLGLPKRSTKAKGTSEADDAKPGEGDKQFEIDFILDHRIIEDEEKI